MKSKKITIQESKITPNINQLRLSKIVLDMIRRGERVNFGKAMKQVGYAPYYCEHPKRIRDSKAWHLLMAEYFNDDLLTAVHLDLLTNKDWRARDKGLDKAYKLRGKYDTETIPKGTSIKNLLVQIYNDKRPLIKKENANPNRSGFRETGLRETGFRENRETISSQVIRPIMEVE